MWVRLMDFIVADIREIFERILSKKLIEKNRKYGNSVYDEDGGVFNSLSIEDRIGTRLDDKLRRLRTLDRNSDKYDSELEEIVAYLLLLINCRPKRVPMKELKPATDSVTFTNKINFREILAEEMDKDDNKCEWLIKGKCIMCGNCMEEEYKK